MNACQWDIWGNKENIYDLSHDWASILDPTTKLNVVDFLSTSKTVKSL